ncbi:putative cadmium-transporting ATPase [Clostridium pasteurianum DSM 525 = ATCC 6013]|uniref:Cd(2+)-exporting ATPase n=1 Tax=Clostridium pasteurianum DSM 525 = ATCC 6013 TaxID=1262449 RepID=A0A0H3JAD9_CLOPA|nr:cation-translocating P-type ATPase [Clostridium pasteurianum]AJA49463.1 putative cadmium-transporting ATPase [Clostridium pasteurianum DSM 525 = ATCC 6013]AJA53451.1 putative cadmium-transporting ATPase [Clostridium pasteurianum DSM 525 = ATCC 6013]AOZ76628.1 cation transporter [Clostridium pasteurianum DSM 525 = ATCC 6013]AOZ80425.1 cation transporter [Clostridium pasteurianum]ELP58421.1 heavy metal translocating P-type ATPase [Clostridium pasteurianum DSM 525 = ATCC 6013]
MKEWLVDEEKHTIIFVVLSGLSLVFSFFNVFKGNLPFDIAWIAIILCGIPIIKGAIEGLITEFDIKADVLVSIALVAAIFIGEIFAAGEVAFIMTIGALLEERTVAKARAGIEKLVNLTPSTARIIINGEERIISSSEVKIGDTLRVLAGESIAVDGIIISGQTSINQAVMTGESLPVDKGVNDEVFSGTVNQFGTFEMRATKVDSDSSMQKMIKLVESADAGKAKIVGMADRWATWIVVIALTAAILTWIFTGEIIRSVTILVVFCPCALVLATPTAIMAGIGNVTKYGILVREGDALERLAKIKYIAFDKTGTLTYGKPIVNVVESFEKDISSEKLLLLTASLEMRSEHPLGKAIVEHFKSVSKVTTKEIENFNMIAGRGVSGKIEKDFIIAGNNKMLSEKSISIPKKISEKADTYINEGCTIIYIAVNQVLAGFIALSDEVRAGASKMIKNIHEIGVSSILLTGDNSRAAYHIANAVGVKYIKSDCLPEDKMDQVDKYQDKGEMICMVGDGINDAPALKKAHVGVAMASIGSDIAVDAADIALVNDDINCIPHLLSLSKKIMKTIKLNLILSMGLNFAAIILAITGILNPIVGALVHNVGSVAVIINSSLLLKWKDKR